MTSLIYGHSKQNKQCGNSKWNDTNFYKISPPSCLFVNFWHMSVAQLSLTNLCDAQSDCHQTSSVIPLARGEEVIKFFKIKVKGQGRWGRYALY